MRKIKNLMVKIAFLGPQRQAVLVQAAARCRHNQIAESSNLVRALGW